MNRNHRLPSEWKTNWGEILIVPGIALLMSIGLFFWNAYAGVAGVVATIFLGVNSYMREHEASTRAIRAVENMSTSFDEVTKNAVFGMPFPMAVLNHHQNFLWYNATFKSVFGIRESLLGKPLDLILPEIPPASLSATATEALPVEVGERSFLFYHNTSAPLEEDGLILLYGVDHTEDDQIRQKQIDDQMVIADVFFDNYDEVRDILQEQDRPMAFATIDRMINDFGQYYEGSVLKYESDRYQMVLTQAGLERMKAEKFSLSDQLKTTFRDELSVRPTVSMGIGYGDRPPVELSREARDAMDIALSRGGDQTVLKSGEQLDYYGGKNQATQRFTTVKARVMSSTVRSLVEAASNVLIMGHQNPDMDSLGSSLGMLTFVEAVGGSAHIVLDSVPSAIENLYDRVIKNLPDAEEKIIHPRQAKSLLKPSTLIIVLDNHRKNAVAAPELIDGRHRIIIIDHHRRGAGYIEEAEISYIEPYASSTSEMVTELISYLDEEVKLNKVVAEALLAGITVDTKNFFYQTGSRTFEAAAFLKRKGADSVVIKEMFKDDFDLMRYRSETLVGAKHLTDAIMISRFPHDIPGSTLIASQAADDLMGIRGVEAAFVLTLSKDKVHISARSLGEISVQLIMEKLGGGGHLTAAATQMEATLDEAEARLDAAIMEYLKEDQDEGNSAE